MVNRRTFLTASGAVALGLAGVSGCTKQPTGTAMRMAWWGNQTRTDLTTKVIDAYQSSHPGVTISGEPGEWASYWDKLATQTAANDAPDIVQFDLKYLREYGDRRALLTLDEAGVQTDGFGAGTLDSCRTPSGLVGVPAGINALTVAVNPAVFERYGIDVPDDQTWTWDDLARTATAISKASNNAVIGSSDFTIYELGFWLWLRQRGKDLFTRDGLGFAAPDAEEFFTFAQELEKSKAIPAVGVSSEDVVAPVAERLFTTGRTAMSLYWSNQVKSLEAAGKLDLRLLRPPSTAGAAKEAGLFLNVSQLWCVPARTTHRDAAVAFVNYLVNDQAAADILLAERGVPANTALADRIGGKLDPSDRKGVAYLRQIGPIVSAAPPAPVAGLAKIETIHTRHLQDVRFGRSQPAEAARAYVAELEGQITK